MNGLREKFRNKKGFTLIEMLIVVAIIAILVAVSIPLVNSSLERARIATDAANERAAKAEAAIWYLGEKVTFAIGATEAEYIYDADSGNLLTTGTPKYGKCADHKDDYIKVTIKKTGEITIAWASGKTAHGSTVPDVS